MRAGESETLPYECTELRKSYFYLSLEFKPKEERDAMKKQKVVLALVLMLLIVAACAPVPHQEVEDVACDYGRNPEKLWPENPDDGHPFERKFCDGLVGPDDPPPHPLDSPENEGLYCDEVPECWAYGQ